MTDGKLTKLPTASAYEPKSRLTKGIAEITTTGQTPTCAAGVPSNRPHAHAKLSRTQSDTPPVARSQDLMTTRKDLPHARRQKTPNARQTQVCITRRHKTITLRSAATTHFDRPTESDPESH